MASTTQQPSYRDTDFVTLFFESDELQLALKGFDRYRPSLEQAREIEAAFGLERSAVTKEIDTVDRMIGWCKDILADLSKGGTGFYQISYGALRWLKAGILFEIDALKQERERVFSGRKLLPKSVVEAVNSKIASLENLAERGLFNGMAPVQLIVGTAVTANVRIDVADAIAPSVVAPSAVMRAELMDSELRRRCGDLYEQFAADPTKQDRFDTVLRDASVVLEERIRRLSGLPDSLIGEELLAKALAVDSGELILSAERNEQKAAHLLFLGFFGFVRNSVGHRLVPNYTRERAAQVLGLADYLLFVASQAKRRNPPPSTPAQV